MTTEKQRDAARANGAKSRGPVTAEGKARSSKNATTHGLTAATVVLPCESEPRFLALIDTMIDAYAPATDYEVSLVERMAALTWQQDRLLGIDTVTLAIQMDVIEPTLNAQIENLSTPVLLALAYRDLANSSRVLPNLDRHASRIRRQFNQIRTELLALQKGRNQKLQNEPTGEQPAPFQPSTNPETVSGTSMTGSTVDPPSAEPASSHPEPGRPSPDSSQKLQNEPSNQQAPRLQQHTSSTPASAASPITTSPLPIPPGKDSPPQMRQSNI